MVENGASENGIARISDIMLASIRTLDFLWDSTSGDSLDYVLDQIIYQFASVAAHETGLNKDDIYVKLLL